MGKFPEHITVAALLDIIESNNIGYFSRNYQSGTLFWSDYIFALAGYTRGEIETDFFIFLEKILHPDDKRRVQNIMAPAVKEPKEYDLICRVYHKSMTLRYVRISTAIHTSEHNGEVFSIGLVQDYTDIMTHRMEALQFKSLVDNAHNEVYVVDESYNYLYANDLALKNLELTAKELLRCNVFDVNPKLLQANVEMLEQELKRSADEAITYKTEHLRKDGTLYPVVSHVSKITFNEQPSYVMFDIDASFANRLEMLIEQSDVVVVQKRVSVGWPIVYMSENISQFGYERTLFAEDKKNFLSIIYGDDASDITARVLEAMREKKKKLHLQYRIYTAEHELRWLEERIVVEYDMNKEPIFLHATLLDITKQKLLQEQLIRSNSMMEHKAHYDALTGLPNRTLFYDRLSQALKKAKRKESRVGLLYLDLDRFKEINDSFGHEVGDKVLKSTATRLQHILRDSDTVSRLGGDEFTVIIEDIEEKEFISIVSEKIIKELEEPIFFNSYELKILTSIGISLFPDDANDVSTLLRNADAAMYTAKSKGRNQFCFYEPKMTEDALRQMTIEAGLRRALDFDEFVLYYQPQIDSRSNTLVGFEALLRWRNASKELIYPDTFLSVAHKSGLIIEIDRRVMLQGMKQSAKWHLEEGFHGVVSLNLVMRQLEQDDFVDFLRKALTQSHCKASWIGLEVTEGDVMQDPENSIKVLRQISQMGIKISIDDFGTGYSSLAYLKKLPIDTLKIDRSFICDIGHGDETEAITRGIIALAKGMKIDIIAEGVDSDVQLSWLRNEGCYHIQGYIYSKAIDEKVVKLRYFQNNFEI